MNRIFKTAALGIMFISFLFASCESKPAETTGNTNTEDLVDGADGGLDSLDLPDNTTDTSGTTVVE